MQGFWLARPWHVEKVSHDLLRQPLADDVFCALHFGGSLIDDDPRRLVIPLPSLGGSSVGGELWRSSNPLRYVVKYGFSSVCSEQIMVLRLYLAESDITQLEDSIFTAYKNLNRLMAEEGYPYLIRVWHYLSDINSGRGNDERYRRFCVGRYRALAMNEDFERYLPAASAIGSTKGAGLCMFAIASRLPGMPVENPHQVSAYRYPSAYGPRSPSFVRGMLVPWADGAQLFVSGTASILGHATRHPGDVLAQARQAITNVEAVRLSAAQDYLGGMDPSSLKLESCYLYIRNDADAPMVSRLVGDSTEFTEACLFSGEICRRDLLVEVEASYRHQSCSSS